MGILRVTSGESVHGVTSDDGFVIGRVTLSGTYSLMMLGAVVGIIGVAAYRAVAPWLIGPLWFRRFTTAVASGAVVGSMLLHADGVDFTLLKHTWLAIALFVALPALFGAVVGPITDRVAAAGAWGSARPWAWMLPLGLILMFPATIGVLLVVVAVVAVWVPLRHGGLARFGERPAVRHLVQAGWLAVALLGLVALIDDVRAISA